MLNPNAKALLCSGPSVTLCSLGSYSKIIILCQPLFLLRNVLSSNIRNSFKSSHWFWYIVCLSLPLFYRCIQAAKMTTAQFILIFKWADTTLSLEILFWGKNLHAFNHIIHDVSLSELQPLLFCILPYLISLIFL